MSNFTEKDVPQQSGRTFVVTGANTGLGFEISRVLAARGARVLLACRSEAKAQAAIAKIKAITADADLDFVALDQGDLASVRTAAEQIKQEPRLDVLINNAGIMVPPLEYTKDGFESQFGVNHLGTFALTGLLLEKLNEQPNSRVVMTASLAHLGAKFFFDDIDAKKSYSAMPRYKQSKLANLMFTQELNRRLRSTASNTIAVAAHPGIADTELPRYMPTWMSGGIPLIRPLMNSAAAGAWPTLMAATAANVQGGDYYGPSKRMESAGPATKAKASSKSKNPELGKQLWDLSVEMTAVDPGV